MFLARNLDWAATSLRMTFQKELEKLSRNKRRRISIKLESGLSKERPSTEMESHQLAGILSVWSDDMRYVFYALQCRHEPSLPASTAARDFVRQLKSSPHRYDVRPFL